MDSSVNYEQVVLQLQNENEELRAKLAYLYAHTVKVSIPSMETVVRFVRENIRMINIALDLVMIVLSIVLMKVLRS